MSNRFFDRNWWKDFVVAILATTVSIVLTFGTTKLVERNNQKKERKLTALMVMSRTPSIPTLTMPRNWTACRTIIETFKFFHLKHVTYFEEFG